jgi:hypothetical protein
MSVEANDALRVPFRLVMACVLLWALLDVDPHAAPHRATSPAPTLVARTITQNTGSMVRPRAAERRPWTGVCPLELDCDGFVWT